MTKEELEKVLFAKRTFVYAVLDGASVPDLRSRLYESNPAHYPLFRGELAPDVAEVSPYVVNLQPGSPFSDWVLSESFGKHWGIFAHSRHSIKEMRRHFRALFTVYDEKGEPLIFRYYDPRVLENFLETCNAEELSTFFGKIDTFFSEDADGKTFAAFTLENGKLRKTAISNGE